MTANAEARRVLIVDDEDAVRQICARVLRLAGFQVEMLASGAEAVARGPEGIDVALIDLSMPRLDGSDTLRALRELAPELPAVVMSGHGKGGFRASGSDAPTRFLAKPFLPRDLSAAVRSALGDGEEAP